MAKYEIYLAGRKRLLQPFEKQQHPNLVGEAIVQLILDFESDGNRKAIREAKSRLKKRSDDDENAIYLLVAAQNPPFMIAFLGRTPAGDIDVRPVQDHEQSSDYYKFIPISSPSTQVH